MRYFNGQATDGGDDDDLGRPPYPDETKMTDEEREYVWNWIDHYFIEKCKSNPSCVIGIIQEWDQKLPS